MTTDFPQPSEVFTASVDTGPLSWVMSEIREALGQSINALQHLSNPDVAVSAHQVVSLTAPPYDKTTALHYAKTYLHQAHGALQMVDIDGVTILTETVEELLERAQSEQALGVNALSVDHVQSIQHAYEALIEYLEELLSGGVHQPVKLFPYYKALLEIRGADRIHPADLFFPDLTIRPQFALTANTNATNAENAHQPIDYQPLRKRFEMALLPFLKSANSAVECANAALMQAVIAEVEQVQDSQQSRAFWWVMQGFADGVANGHVPNELYVKQLFARINLQLRRLSQGSHSTSERLLRDALFFIAGIQNPSAHNAQIRHIYRLGGVVPTDFQTRHYGQVNSEALRAAKEHLARAKNIWDRLAVSVSNDARLIQEFAQEMRSLSDLGSKLNAPSLCKLLCELSDIAQHAAHANPGDPMGLEMAKSLLFVENALAHINRSPEHFSQHADTMTARLLAIMSGEAPSEPAPWQDDIYREVQQKTIVKVLAGEILTSLRYVEKMLDEYFSAPEKHEVLAQIDHVLHQIEGALAIQEQPDALAVVIHTRTTLHQFAHADGIDSQSDAIPPGQQDFELIAQNIGALSFYVETIWHQSDTSDGVNATGAQPIHLNFDAQHGVFRVNLLERHSASAPLPESVTLIGQPSPSAQTDAAIGEVAQYSGSIDHAAVPSLSLLDLPSVEENIPELLLSAPAQVTEAQADAELLEIFLCEAEEVLKCVRETVPQARLAPADQGHLVVLRRAFHTLKGSSRMIGMRAFGDAAWSVEEVLNLWLTETRSGTPDVYALLDHAVMFLGDWVKEVSNDGVSIRTAQILAEYAQQVRDGETFLLVESATESTHATDLMDEVADLPFLPTQAEEVVLSDADMALFADHTHFSASPEDTTSASQVAIAASAEIISFPGLQEVRQDDSIKRIGDLFISLPLYNIYLAETDQLVRLLAQDFAEWRHEPERPVTVYAIHAAHSLAGSSATVGFAPLRDIAHALEMLLQRMALQPMPIHEEEFDLIDTAVVRAKWMLQQFAQSDIPYYEPELVGMLDSMHSVRNGHEVRIDDDDAYSIPPQSPSQTTLPSIVTPQAFTSPIPAPIEFDHGLTLRDEIDVDLLPVFLEEGRDILTHIESALRSWQKMATVSSHHVDDADNVDAQDLQPSPIPVETAQAILRHLHTIKGSARMAGAMMLGQHMHEMESHIEATLYGATPSPHVIDGLLAHYDHGVQMFESLQHGQPTALVQSDTHFNSYNPASALATTSIATAAFSPANTLPVAQVRVNAEVLDRFVNQAGEVSIARSRLESGVGTLQQSLLDLTENVDRLRGQLREIEIQAETQMSSRMTLAGEREFDPLEFDRFTRLQELTRMMAESVSDVSSLQKTLTKTVDDVNTDLVTQGRLTRDLQQDLMHVRMVQFASIAERLYRMTRQVAKELDKRVSLDIRGGTVEIDRSVLEKMVGPFEHLLRNAIVHGIESRELRRAAGKSDIGELKIEIRQDGNEVLIHLSDDGQGLNLSQIRDKARLVGLLEVDQQLSDVETTDLIFKPGFTTVAELTNLAGRGVGMDVVRSEAAALGGRVAVFSEAGKGTHFTIHLPLTLAVTQVVIFSTGGNTYAVPSALVEQVQQLKATALASAYNDGAVVWQDQKVPLHYASALLGQHQVTPVAQQYSPIIILRSGNDRVAIHVDDIVGNREVVVKNIGPQLSRLIGIVGATVLGSGEIVLILNPVPLALRYAQERRSTRTATVDIAAIAMSEAQTIGAVANFGTPNDSAGPIQGLRVQKIVMVVDDSLTVRRVTQRLLSREGYQVVLAKDGIDALQQLQAMSPDVMLVDIEMPRMDGFDLTRNIRNDERTRHIPIIMITSRTAAKHRTYAMELGVNDYLGKPYQEDVLLRMVAGFVHGEAAAL
ncbi:Hpt domain-containing protein [Glaciimonas sp. GG7]